MKRLIEWWNYKRFERQMLAGFEDAPERITKAFKDISDLMEKWPSLPKDVRLARLAAPSIHAHMTNNSDWGLERTTEYFLNLFKDANPDVIDLTDAVRIISFERERDRRRKLREIYEKSQRAWYRRLWFFIRKTLSPVK